VPPNDPAILAEKIIELLSDETLRAAMGRRGRQRVLKLFTIERQVQEVVSIYEKVTRVSCS
jgi:glycosyltransferase involved in cell wall biosynthesis